MRKPLALFILLLLVVALVIGLEKTSEVSSVSIQEQSWVHETEETNNCSYDIRLSLVEAEPGGISDSVAQAVNDKIMDTALLHVSAGSRDIDTEMAQFLSDCTEDLALNSPPGSAWFADVYSTVTQNEDGLLSMFVYWQGFTGGAHPNYASEGLVFDLNTGKQLFITDLIRSDRLDAFKSLLVQRILDTGITPELIDLYISAPDFVTEYGSVYLTPEELSIIYNPYEIASGPNTIEPITFSREELKDYLQIN